MSETAEKLLKLKGDMKRFARQNVTGSVNSSNLLRFASAGDLRRGYDVIRDASDMSGIHVVHTTGRENILKEFLAGGRGSRYIGDSIHLVRHICSETWTPLQAAFPCGARLAACIDAACIFLRALGKGGVQSSKKRDVNPPTNTGGGTSRCADL